MMKLIKSQTLSTFSKQKNDIFIYFFIFHIYFLFKFIISFMRYINHKSLLKPLLIPSNILAVNVYFFFDYDLISF